MSGGLEETTRRYQNILDILRILFPTLPKIKDAIERTMMSVRRKRGIYGRFIGKEALSGVEFSPMNYAFRMRGSAANHVVHA